jgi:response regulator RpfG family c-di-GMP phosphodiesterase
MAGSLGNRRGLGDTLLSNRRVLFVDDEVNVVEGIKRQVRKSFDVFTATNPREALALVQSEPDFAVIVSDMRMPQMSGVEFLSAVKKARPETIRVMLTGNQDQLTAAAAVNDGEVFKFLNKPCDVVSLSAVLEQALRQYQLVTAERELLTRTVQGSIKLLVEALSIAKPELFGSIDRIERRCSQIAEQLQDIEPWEMRAAARLSRIGCIGISAETIENCASGAQVGKREREAYESHPMTGAKMIGEIPRLERVAQYVLYQHKNFDGSGFPKDGLSGSDIPLGARVLRLVLAFDQYTAAGQSDARALEAIAAREGQFDPALFAVLRKILATETRKEFKIPPGEIYSGLIIGEDVQSKRGVLIVCRGQAVTSAVERHIKSLFELGRLSEPILVISSA